VDIGLTVALLVPVVFFPVTGFPAAFSVLSFVQIAPLVVRRLWPVACLAAVTAAMVVQVLVLQTPIWGQVAMPVAIYSVAAFTDRRRAGAALTVGLAGALVGPLDWYVIGFPTDPLDAVGMVVAIAVLVVAAWALGTLARTRRAYVAELIDRGDRLEREAAQLAELAAADERARIAREMHDVVAHGLSVIVVQADGARYAAAQDPAAAGQALETIAGTGRSALAEMRRMLGLLRAEDAGTGTRPQPALADLASLLDEAEDAGTRLHREIGPLPTVPAGVGLTAYRVVQEALTNVRKHAGPDALATVRVHAQRPAHAGASDALVIEVLDDGHGAAAGAHPGHGLIGMRERVAVHGGTLQVGPRRGGGYAVSAMVPLHAEEAVS
jgi:signal transduction histidine kinase